MNADEIGAKYKDESRSSFQFLSRRANGLSEFRNR